MLQNQQDTCLVRRTIYPPYHFIGGSLQLCTWVYNDFWCSRKCPHQCRMPFVEREHFASDSVWDRKHHLEGYILSFIAENSLPLSVVPKLIEFSQFLCRHPKALYQLRMNRTAASYKLKHGLLVHICKSSWLYEKVPFLV